MDEDREGMEQTDGDPSQNELAANYLNPTVTDLLFEVAVTSFVIDGMLNGLWQDSETGDFAETELRGYLRDHTSLSASALAHVVDLGLWHAEQMAVNDETRIDLRLLRAILETEHREYGQHGEEGAAGKQLPRWLHVYER